MRDDRVVDRLYRLRIGLHPSDLACERSDDSRVRDRIAASICMKGMDGLKCSKRRTKTSSPLSLFRVLFTPAFIAVITLQRASRADTLRGRVIRQSSPQLSPSSLSLCLLKECCNFLNCFYESTRSSFLPSVPSLSLPLPPAARCLSSTS